MSDFEAYRRRAERIKQLEALLVIVKEYLASSKFSSSADRLRALGRVVDQVAALDRLPPPNVR